MDATPISFDTATPLGGTLPAGGLEFADAVAEKWSALHEAAYVVATLAGIVPPAVTSTVGDFPATVGRAAHWRRELAEQGVEDLTAIMAPGLAALISVHTGGADATAPARALWQEFVAARDALVAIVCPED